MYFYYLYIITVFKGKLIERGRDISDVAFRQIDVITRLVITFFSFVNRIQIFTFTVVIKSGTGFFSAFDYLSKEPLKGIILPANLSVYNKIFTFCVKAF